MKSDEQLKQQNPLLYKVAREAATEMPFSGEYIHTKASGDYHCAVCDAKLFSSDAKFDSDSGWPAFRSPMGDDAVVLSTDNSYRMQRTSVSCKTCGAHLGHAFLDQPIVEHSGCSGYCINSVSLTLKKDHE